MMRQPQDLKVRPGAQKSRSSNLPAPIGGLNARDSVANMDRLDAVLMDNFFPKTTSVDVRNGLTAWNTFTGVCQSILVYTGATATHVFPCVRNGATYSIYNGTSSGALSVAVVGGGGATVQALTAARFDYANFGTAAGQFLTVVNGADPPLQYNGAAWSVSATTGGTVTDYFTVAVFGQRLFYGIKNSLSVRYLATGLISGATTVFELGSLFKLGGYLNSIITVSDNSNTLQDYIGFLSSEGEVVAFAGYDPASWSIAAHFRIGRPVIKGNRCWCKWGADALVICADGIYPLRAAIQADSRSAGLSVSDKIRNLINGDVAINGARYGWGLTVHPTGSKLIVNVPTNEDVAARQYVMNTETGSWCRFTGWNGFVFEVARDTLYMGMSGKMVKADVGMDDLGTAIVADAKQAFNYLGARGRAKHMKLMRPILAVNGAFNLGIGVDVDYGDTTISFLRPVGGGSGDPWGGVWDVAWSGGVLAELGWYGVNGIGHAIAPKLKVQTDDILLSWSATDLVHEDGGVVA